MRVFKFRVWDKTQKKMYYPEEFGEQFAIGIGGTLAKRYICDDTINCYEDNYIIQPYIGSQDKNGKDIYEGDLCNFICCTPNLEVVYYESCYYCIPSNTPIDDNSCRFNEFDTKECLVIGNICENQK